MHTRFFALSCDCNHSIAHSHCLIIINSFIHSFDRFVLFRFFFLLFCNNKNTINFVNESYFDVIFRFRSADYEDYIVPKSETYGEI